MAAPLVERSTGDVIPASDHNDVKDYIEDGTYRVNTLSLNIGGTEVIDSSLNLTNINNTGISNTNFVVIDDADAAENDYTKLSTSGLVGRSYSEVKTDLSLDNVENTAISTWGGSSNITTVGTIGTGTWQGTDVAVGYIDGSSGTNGQVLTSDGTDASWATLDISNDTTPQLGGNLDINDKAITEELTAGENVADGDLCYLKSDGKMWKADASAESTSSTTLAMATATISADDSGTFLIYGNYTSSSLTAGSIYYVSETGGEITTTAPTTSTSIVRLVGTAKSTTVLFFNPDTSYIELS